MSQDCATIKRRHLPNNVRQIEEDDIPLPGCPPSPKSPIPLSLETHLQSHPRSWVELTSPPLTTQSTSYLICSCVYIFVSFP